MVCPWMLALRRAPPTELHSALLRAKKRLSPPNTSGLGGASCQGGEAPSGGASLLLITTQMSGVGAQAERVAIESVCRIRPSCAPHMKWRSVNGEGVGVLPLVRAVANEREFICEATRILFAPYAPSRKGLAPPTIRPEGMVQTLAALRTLSRMVVDAARIETPFLRAFEARFGYLMKYNMPAPKGPQSSAIATQSPVKQDGPSGPPKKASAENKPAGHPAERSHERGRSARASRKVRGGQKSRRSRSPRRPATASSADTLVEERVRDERLAAW